MSENERSLAEKLLDPECDDDITLYDEDDNEIVFGQVAVIPMDGSLYAILTPVTPVEGVEEGAGIVFVLEEIDDEEALSVVSDEATVDRVFDEYEALCAEEDE